MSVTMPEAAASEMSNGAAAPSSLRINAAGRVMLLCSGCCGIVAVNALTPVLPAIASHFASTPAAQSLTRLLVSLIGIMVVVGSPIAGALADRFGARRVLVSSLIAYALAGSVGFLLDSLYALLMTRVLVGLATAAEGTASIALLIRHSDSSARNTWLGYIMTTGALMGLVVIPLASYLGHLGWRAVFLIYLVTVPLALLARYGFEPDMVEGPQVRAEAPVAERHIPMLLLLFAVGAGVVMMAPYLYIPFRVREIGIEDPARIGMAMLPTAVGTAIMGVFFGRVRARLALEPTFVVSFGIFAAGLALAGLAERYDQIVCGVALLGIGAGLAGPNLLALAAVTGPATRRAQTTGLARAGLYAGTLVGQIVLDPVARWGGASYALWALALLALGLAFLRLGCALRVRGVRVERATGT